MTGGRLKVALVFGGRSVEHEVSIVSARSFFSAMDKDKYEHVLVGIDTEGHWFLVGDSFDGIGERLSSNSGKRIRLLDDGSPALRNRANSIEGKRDAQLGPIDVLVPMVHGSFGEDGCIQGLCELLDIPYVGAGVLGSALGMDKITMKRILQAAGIRVVDFIPVLRRDWERAPDTISVCCES